MLGDNSGKSKNPVKIALKRRGCQVKFTAPTFYEPPDDNFSSDEDEEGSEGGSHGEEAAERQNGEEEENGVERSAMVEPLRAGGTRPSQDGPTITMVNASGDESINGTEENDSTLREANNEDAQLAEEGTSPRSRKGTVRNTDSFFKDDTVETRKISLTPNLLRDDSSSSTGRSSENKEVSRVLLFRRHSWLKYRLAQDQRKS